MREPEVGSKGGPLPPTPRARARVQFGPPTAQPVVVEQAKPAKTESKPKVPRIALDPALVSKARELRDRYLERVNHSPAALPAPRGKYDVARALAPVEPQPTLLLPAA